MYLYLSHRAMLFAYYVLYRSGIGRRHRQITGITDTESAATTQCILLSKKVGRIA